MTTDAEGFFLNLGVLGGLNGEFASDQYVNILLSESDAPFNDNTSNNAADIFARHGSVQASSAAGGLGGLAVCVCAVFGVRGEK